MNPEIYQKLEEAERSGRRLTPKGQAMLQEYRASQQAQQQAPQQSMLGRAWDMTKIPENMARQAAGAVATAGQRVSPQMQAMGSRAAQMLMPVPGIGAMTDAANVMMSSQRAEPTGNLPMDVAKALPRIGSEVAAEYYPGYLSPASLLTMGGLKGAQYAGPRTREALQGLGAQMENMVGSPAGTLEAAAGDSTRVFQKGRKAAQPFYEAAKAKLPEMADDALAWNPEEVAARHVEEVYNTAVQKAAGNTLTPVEALEGRKGADAMLGMKKYAKDALHKGRKLLAKIAKTDENIAKGDVLHEAGMKNEALRRILPQNKYGGTSAFKLGVMTALKFIPGIGPLLAAQMSPIVQGAEAAAGGLVARHGVIPLINNPRAVGGLIAAGRAGGRNGK